MASRRSLRGRCASAFARGDRPACFGLCKRLRKAFGVPVEAVETVVDTYMARREGPQESFLAAYRRLGPAPFKEALYERNEGADI